MKLAPYVLIAILAIVGFFYIKNLGKIACENKQKTVIIEGEKNRDKIDHENQSLERVTIINRLNDDGWLRK